MIKKSLLLFTTLFLFVISSCNFITEKSYTDVAFSFGENTAFRTLSNVVNEDSEFNISCNFIGLNLPSANFSVTRNKLSTTSFKLDNIPLNEKFSLVINIKFNNNTIYIGEAKNLMLNENDLNKQIQIILKEKLSTIDYDCGDGDFPIDVKDKLITTYFLDDIISIDTVPTPTKTGSTFDGWYFDNKCETPATDFGKKDFKGDVTLYAKWNTNQYTITYETNCDKTIAPKTVDYNYALTSSDLTSSGLTKNDCTFAGWYVEDKIIKIGDKVTKNIKLIAKWDFGTVAVNQTITKDGSTSINATPYDYVLFGEWPQTLKSTSVTIDESMTGTYNGWTCYKGNDNAYYVKIKANPKDDTNSTNRNNELFNDGVTRIIHDEYYYFKIEPIRWRVLTTNYNNTGNKLLLAEKVLARNPLTSNEAYNKGSRKILVDSTFKHDIYHNGCFFDRAFSTESKNKIAFTEITADNTIYNDKLFLLDKTEMGDTAFGFQSDIYNTSDSYRQRQPTDFAKATGVYIDNPDGTWWWLRSKDSIGPSGREVQYGLGSSDGGMVPALCLPNSLVF